MRYDDQAAALLEQAYLTSEMVAQREVSRRALDASRGETILDLGSGPGFLACELAQEVGAAGRIIAVDVSPEMNALAHRRAAGAGLIDRIEIVESDAAMLPLATATVDAAVSTQVLEYVADPVAALLELGRVMRPGGRLVLIDTDWDSLVWAGNDDQLCARIEAAWDEHLPDPHLPRTLSPRLREAGFAVQHIQVIPILNTTYEPSTFSYNIAALIAAFVPGHLGISERETTQWLEDLEELHRRGRYFFSLNRYLFVATLREEGAGR